MNKAMFLIAFLVIVSFHNSFSSENQKALKKGDIVGDWRFDEASFLNTDKAKKLFKNLAVDDERRNQMFKYMINFYKEMKYRIDSKGTMSLARVNKDDKLIQTVSTGKWKLQNNKIIYTCKYTHGAKSRFTFILEKDTLRCEKSEKYKNGKFEIFNPDTCPNTDTCWKRKSQNRK